MKSTLVEQLLERNKQTPLHIYEPDQKNKKLGEPDEKLTNDAYNRICELWNKDDKARGFIKYIISCYYPLNPMNKILSFPKDLKEAGKNRCCILGKTLAGVKDISDAWGPVIVLRVQEDTRAAAEGRKTPSKEFLKKQKEMLSKMPIEVRKSTLGYYSDKKGCEKYLSGEAFCALNEFIEDCLYGEEEEMCNLIKKIEYEATKPKFNHRGGNGKASKEGNNNYKLNQFISDDTLKKLSKIKEGN